MQVRSLGQENPLEEGLATLSSVLAWRIPWTEKPGGLQSMGSQGWTRLKQLSTYRRISRDIEVCTITINLTKTQLSLTSQQISEWAMQPGFFRSDFSSFLTLPQLKIFH